jgi:orotate phosphoribosyltransferase
MLFGPAYKGIPLATALSLALARRGRDVPVAFNRKEAKDHGEGGTLIGAPLAGRVLIVDDVITAGTAIREALAIIRGAGATPAGVVIALDRQERGQAGSRSAVQEVEAEFGLPVVAVAGLGDLLAFADERPDLAAHKPALLAYRAQYGAQAPSQEPTP